MRQTARVSYLTTVAVTYSESESNAMGKNNSRFAFSSVNCDMCKPRNVTPVCAGDIRITEFAQSPELECSGTDDNNATLKIGDEPPCAADESVLSIISPLLTCMKLFGIYYSLAGPAARSSDWNAVSPNESGRPTAAGNGSSIQPPVWTFGRVYSSVVIVFLWLNVVRLSTIFTAADQFSSLLVYKLVVLGQSVLCAAMFTSYYVGCVSGKLDDVLRRILTNAERPAEYRRKAKLCSLFVWLFMAFGLLQHVYLINFSKGRFNFMLTPFEGSVQAGTTQERVIKAVVVGLAVFLLPLWVYPVAMNHIITTALFDEFRLLNRRFVAAVDTAGRFGDSIGAFRRQHQALCRTVQTADHFVKYGNVGGFLCHVVTIIFLLYTAMFHKFADVFAAVACVYCLFYHGFLLTLMTTNGIAVNHAAHKLSDRIHNIDMSSLKADDVTELQMFQKRLSGEPIGFSVLGIFVINKRTVLSLLGLLITYFLLVVQLSTPINAKYDDTSGVMNRTRTDV